MKKLILKWLFGNDLGEYIDVLRHWTKATDGWGAAINLANDAIARNERLIELTNSLLNRYTKILRNAIVAYEFELENQDYETEKELHVVVLNEFDMTDEEYRYIMGVNENETLD